MGVRDWQNCMRVLSSVSFCVVEMLPWIGFSVRARVRVLSLYVCFFARQMIVKCDGYVKALASKSVDRRMRLSDALNT
jgi:hypothetical protein